MKAFSLLLLAFAPCVHAAGRFEVTGGPIFLQSDLAAPSVEPYSGLLPCGDFSLRWVWPNGFKLGGRHVSPMYVPHAKVSDRMTESLNLSAKGLAIVPDVSLLEMTLPLFRPGAFSLSATLGAGSARWRGGNEVIFKNPDMTYIEFVTQNTFACSALLNMNWEMASHFALHLYGGYVYLGKPDFSRLEQGFKSDVGGLAFGLGFSIK